jgi:hypothetical protein
MKTKVIIVPNPNHETKKTRIKPRHVQDKNLGRLYCKNEVKTKLWQNNVPKSSVQHTKCN